MNVLVNRFIQATPIFNFSYQIRTTFIIKRKHEPMLPDKEGHEKKLRSRHFVYDLVEFTECRRQENINVILLDYIEGVGLKGEEVSVRKTFARRNLLLPRLAVYATDESREKYKMDSILSGSAKLEHSSKTAEKTIKLLSKLVASLAMNIETHWTVEPWHVKASLRNVGFMVPDHAITLPSKPICGPNLELEGKCFLTTIMINGLEKALVRCCIHHWHANPVKRLHLEDDCVQTMDPIFAEDSEILKRLPEPQKPG